MIRLQCGFGFFFFINSTRAVSSKRVLNIRIGHPVYNRLSTVQSFTSTRISWYWVSGRQAGMALNKCFFIKDSLCLITCNKKLLCGVRSNG